MMSDLPAMHNPEAAVNRAAFSLRGELAREVDLAKLTLETQLDRQARISPLGLRPHHSAGHVLRTKCSL